MREQKSLAAGMNLRNNYAQLPHSSFQTRKDYVVQNFKEGSYLKNPGAKGQPPANPMSDPAAMEGMMGMMKGNMMMMIPQTLIMSWINAFFSGFVISTSSQKKCLPYQLQLLTDINSETAVSSYDSFQVDAAIGGGNAGLGCAMGLVALVVLP